MLLFISMNYLNTKITPLVLGLLIGGLGMFAAMNTQKSTSEDRIAEFYATETAVYVSPHSVRKKIAQGQDADFVLVDVRSSQEYKTEHIIGALNVPAYKDPETAAYDDVDRIVDDFRKIQEENPNKDIIVYCYSTACMSGRKIGNLLASHGIFVKELTIGWNEWRYAWNMWNHSGEKPSAVEDYIFSGSQPGEPKAHELLSPCTEGELGC